MSSTKTRSKGNAKGEAKAKRERLLAALNEAREAGNYPLTVRQLAGRWEASAEEALKLLKGNDLKPFVILASRTSVESPVAMAEDKTDLARSDLLLHFTAAAVRSKRMAKRAPLGAEINSFVKDAGLPKELQPLLEETLQQLKALFR